MPTAVPDLSVVISTHNRPVEVREAIASVVGQDHDGTIECVVVWDKTEPERDLARDDPRRPVRVMANDGTPGLPGSRNCGAAASTGAVIGFSDDDDLWEPSKARKQLALMERTGAPAVGCGIRIVGDDSVSVRECTGSAVRFEDLVRARVPEAYMGTIIVRREAFFDRIGPLDEHIPGGFAEDYEFWLRAARHAPVPIVEEPLFTIRWTGGSFFRDKWQNMDDALVALLERFPEFEADPKGLARILGQRAFAQAALGNRSEAGRLARAALRANPAELRAPLALAVAAGVPADRVMAGLNRVGRGI